MKILYTLSFIVLCAGSAVGQVQEITVVAWMRELYSREDHDWGSREEYRCSYSINNQYANPCASAENVDSQQWERFSNNELQTTLSVSATSFQMSLTVWEEDGGDGCKIDDGGDSDSNHGIMYYPTLTTLNPRSDNNITRVINNSADSRKGYQLAYTIFWFSNTLKKPAFSQGPGREVCFADDLRVETSYHGMSSAMSATYYWEVYDEDSGTTTPYSRSDNKLDLRDHIRFNPSSSRNLQVRVATFVRGMQASIEFSEWFDVTINGTPAVTMGNIFQPECAGQKGRVSVSWVSGASDRYNLYLVRDGVTVKQYLDLPAWTSYTFDGVEAGTYSLKVADRTGASCFYEMSNITINAAPPPLEWRGVKSDFNGFNVSCAGNADGYITLSASGGTGQYVFLHENSEIASFGGKSAGTYAITIRDKTYPSCEITVSETLTPPGDLNVGEITTLPVSCRNSPEPDGVISIASVVGGVAPYQYQLDDGPWADNNVFPSLAAGRYNVSVKDKNNCVVTLEAEVAQPLTNVWFQVIEKSDISCFGGNNGFFVIRGEGGTAFEGGRYKFSIDDGVFSEPGTEQRYEGLTVGTYHVTIQDKNGCIHETDVSIAQPDPIASEQTITSESCAGASDGAAVIVLSQGTGPYFYFDVTSEDTLAVDPASNTIVVGGLAAGAHSLKVTDSNGCADVPGAAWLEIPFTVPATPALEVFLEPGNLTPATCIGSADGNVTITARDGTPGYWFSNDGENFVAANDGHRHLFGNLVGGATYTFYARDSRACTSNIELTIPQPQVPDIDDEIVLCPGQTYEVEVSLNGTYRWTSTNGFFSAERKVRLSEGGTYLLRVTTDQHCQIEQSFDVRILEAPPEADLLMSTKAVEGDTLVAIDLSSPQPDTRAWNYDADNISHIRSEEFYEYFRFNKAGTHSLMFIASIGACSDTLIHYVEVSGRAGLGAPDGRLDYEESFVHSFNAWPNPASGRFSIDVELGAIADIKVTLFSAVTSRPLFIETGSGSDHYRLRIDAEGYPAGLYFLELETSKGDRKVVRLIIEN